MKTKIIFVDDEKSILDGLRRVLRPARKHWDMSFVSSGQDALTLFSNNSFDVIISDMRMPHMNGIELLTEICQKHPQTLRVVLSGYSESALILESVRVAHQYLPKPSDYSTIKSTVDSALRLKSMLRNEKVSTLVAKIQSLPSLPQIFDDINEELSREDCSLLVIAELISADISMTAKLLQICNSAYFGLSRAIESPMDAVNYLGIDTIKSLVLSIKIFEEFSDKEEDNSALLKVWTLSQTVAILAKDIARQQNSDKAIVNQSYTGGLLHNIGEIIVRHEFKSTYPEIEDLQHEQGLHIIEAEQKVLGFSHDIVGAYLLDLWGLPSSICSCSAFLYTDQHLNFDNPGSAEFVFIAYSLIQDLNEGTDNRVRLSRYFPEETIDVWKQMAQLG